MGKGKGKGAKTGTKGPPRLSESQKSKARLEVARKLAAARGAAGLSQTVVAKRVRMSPSVVSKIERGERALDPLELARFARLYGMSIVDFISQVRP